MVPGKLPGPGRPTIWMTVGQGSTALAVGAGGLFAHFYSPIFSLLFLPLWETARYILKYYGLKGPLNPKTTFPHVTHKSSKGNKSYIHLNIILTN